MLTNSLSDSHLRISRLIIAIHRCSQTPATMLRPITLETRNQLQAAPQKYHSVSCPDDGVLSSLKYRTNDGFRSPIVFASQPPGLRPASQKIERSGAL